MSEAQAQLTPDHLIGFYKMEKMQKVPIRGLDIKVVTFIFQHTEETYRKVIVSYPLTPLTNLHKFQKEIENFARYLNNRYPEYRTYDEDVQIALDVERFLYA